jgi:dihydroorotase
MKILISNGRVVDPRNGSDGVADICIAAGKIVSVGEVPADFHPNRTLDASGLTVIPGLVDLSVRLREPGYEYKATLESEMAAAAAGGVTSLVCPPDTDPPLDEPGLVEMLKFRAKGLGGAKVYPLGALTQKLEGRRLAEMAELAESGCIAFGQGEAGLPDNEVLLRAMEYAATQGYAVWLRPQDTYLSAGGVAHDGPVASRLGLAAIPALSETIALSTLLLMASETGVRLHLCRISSREGVAMVRAARKQGIKVSCDVGVNHLHLSEIDTAGFDANFHLSPPLRGIADRDAIRAALKDRSIDAVCSDHSPVDDDAKLLPFGESEAGATGLELLLPLTLKWADEMQVPLREAIEFITWKPAQVLGIDTGHLSPGTAADLCIYDPETIWKVTPESLISQGKNTPFQGGLLTGRVRYTLVDGHLIFGNHA